ncbi:cell wall protein DAN4-like isoform X2 [Juglans microcarpa x Juglans regia]|uniref:cell wall protein DAN4-like isoform X2 n=1 Tax=Juglans microcarpa x Juglans regia TaxID=2249226 RepID=UPI001B7DAF67|nr:cell wall protein DAN4-like isoform X2 [Juglans microcarpa x Juglans regia]
MTAPPNPFGFGSSISSSSTSSPAPSFSLSFHSAPAVSSPAASLFGALTSSSTATTASSMFGTISSAASSASPFFGSATLGSPFGTASSAGTSGSSATGSGSSLLLASLPASTTSSSLFGTAASAPKSSSSSIPFGTTLASTTPTSASPLFGATSASGSTLFGTTVPSASPGLSPFGSSISAPSSTPSIFGTTSFSSSSSSAAASLFSTSALFSSSSWSSPSASTTPAFSFASSSGSNSTTASPFSSSSGLPGFSFSKQSTPASSSQAHSTTVVPPFGVSSISAADTTSGASTAATQNVASSSSGERKCGGEGQASSEVSETRRSILVEREIIIDDFRDFVWDGRSLFSIINDRGWALICQQTGVAYPNMINEFYLAMGQMEANEESFTFTIREVSITISADIISNFLGIPREIGAYPAQQSAAGTDVRDAIEDEALADDGPTDDEICQLMHDDSAPPYDGSKVIRQVDCIAFFRMLNLIVSYNIDPRKHKTDFGIERARFMLRIARGEPIDLPLYILLRIRSESQYSSESSLPFALMISNLLVQLGVNVLINDRRQPQIGPLNKITFIKSDGHLRKARINIPAAGATIMEIRSLLEDHRILLIQEMEKITAPIMVRLQEIEGRISVMQEDLDDLT